jgi:hypothetical protein
MREEALAAFTRFFLETCLDQVRFMAALVQPNRLRDRILIWAEEEVRAGTLPARAGQVLEAVLFRGELPRGDVPALLGTGDRQARRVVSALLDRGILTSPSTRAPLSLTFPAALAPTLDAGPVPGAAELIGIRAAKGPCCVLGSACCVRKVLSAAGLSAGSAACGSARCSVMRASCRVQQPSAHRCRRPAGGTAAARVRGRLPAPAPRGAAAALRPPRARRCPFAR